METRKLHLLLAALCTGLIPAAAHAQFTYTTNAGGTNITITGYDWNNPPLAIPDTIDDLPVTGIGNSAFQGCPSLTNLIIPASVTTIGNGTFRSCFNLTNVVIPANVTNLGNYAFASCHKLAGASIGNGITRISDMLFDNCHSLSDVTIPDSVTNIGYRAFFGCDHLTSIEIPPNVASIGTMVFYFCNSLTAITVDPLNSNYCSVAGILFDKSKSTLIQFPPGKIGDYTVPDGVTTIGDDAFGFCSGLSSLTFPASVTHLGSYFFGPDSGLTNITVHPLNASYRSEDGILFNKNQTTLLQYPPGKSGATYSVTNIVNAIGATAFAFATSLTNITIPDSIVSIGDHAFDRCYSLSHITIPDSVTNLGNRAFQNCSSLTDFRLPNSITTIEEGVFSGCSGLTNFTFGNGVTSIGNSAFAQCLNMVNLTFGSGVTNIGYGAFAGCDSLTGIFFRTNAPTAAHAFDNSVIAYYLPGTTGWEDFATLSGIATALWLPQIQTADASFGIHSNQFGFKIAWASGQTFVIEASTSLAPPAWFPLRTNTLTTDTLYFNDPDWTNYPSRFYRLRSP